MSPAKIDRAAPCGAAIRWLTYDHSPRWASTQSQLLEISAERQAGINCSAQLLIGSADRQHDFADMRAGFHPGVRGGGFGQREGLVHYRAQLSSHHQGPS